MCVGKIKDLLRSARHNNHGRQLSFFCFVLRQGRQTKWEGCTVCEHQEEYKYSSFVSQTTCRFPSSTPGWTIYFVPLVVTAPTTHFKPTWRSPFRDIRLAHVKACGSCTNGLDSATAQTHLGWEMSLFQVKISSSSSFRKQQTSSSCSCSYRLTPRVVSAWLDRASRPSLFPHQRFVIGSFLEHSHCLLIC